MAIFFFLLLSFNEADPKQVIPLLVVLIFLGVLCLSIFCGQQLHRQNFRTNLGS
ncbi:hypothetical protein AWRIB553_577 [Oenococcus oeni AWRIB553]|nr:hypothetical protein AWRIB553_577 [Oenococcus oeni AWRIB553]